MGKIVQIESCRCDFCNGNDEKFLFKMPDLRFRNFDQEYSVVECNGCGHRYLSPRPVLEQINILYPEKYYADRGTEVPNQKRRYEKQSVYLPGETGKILEVGCAGGAWLEYIKQQGWECYGNDFIKSPYKEKNVIIQNCSLIDVDFPEKYFDVICAWGVMEHVYEPSTYFLKIHQLLKDKGTFIFMVPNGSSLWSRWAFKEDVPRHVHFFRPKILKKYAEKYRFKVLNIDFTNAIYSRPATGRGMFRNQALYQLGISWEEIVNEPKNSFARLISLIAKGLDRLLIHPGMEEWLHLSGNMIVIFQKR